VKRNWFCLFLVLLAAASGPIFWSGPAAAESVSAVDSLGRRVVLARPPERIIPLFSGNSEIVAALGLMDKIVGVDALVSHPPEMTRKPFVGGRLGFSVETIVHLEPDLVIMSPSRQAVPQLLPPLERMGIPVAIFNSESLPALLANIKATAQLCGVPQRGHDLAGSMKRELDELAQKARGRLWPRVVMVNGQVGPGLILVTREGSYTADIITAAGGRLALEENHTRGPRLNQISLEVLLAIDPDIIIYTVRHNQQVDLDALAARPGWADLRAVREKRLYLLPSGEFLIPGPRVILGVRRLAGLFEAWAGLATYEGEMTP
jgi:iron complex transport system substrate-binding protein